MKTVILKTLFMVLSLGICRPVLAVSNIVLDGTTGTTNTIATSPLGTGTQYTLDGLTNGTRNGANLFFSFNQFNISAGDTALFQCGGCFNNPPFPNVNVIARVTGASASIIDGTLRSTVGTNGVAATLSSFTAADFWLFNPNGIVIGSGATINLGSSFGLTNPRNPIFYNGDKANRVIFTDGTEFGLTTSPSSSTLTVVAGTANNRVPTPNLPVSFGFPPPPTITITPTPEPTPTTTTPTTQVEIVPVQSTPEPTPVPEPTVVIVSESEPRNIDAVLVKPILPVSVPTPPDKLKPCASHAKSSLINKSVANYQPKHSVQVPYGLSDKTINTLSSQTASGSESSTECHENNP